MALPNTRIQSSKGHQDEGRPLRRRPPTRALLLAILLLIVFLFVCGAKYRFYSLNSLIETIETETSATAICHKVYFFQLFRSKKTLVAELEKCENRKGRALVILALRHYGHPYYELDLGTIISDYFTPNDFDVIGDLIYYETINLFPGPF